MAIINCPECGKEISDTTEVCIHCGYRLKKEQPAPVQRKSKKKMIITLAVLGGILTFLFIFGLPLMYLIIYLSQNA